MGRLRVALIFSIGGYILYFIWQAWGVWRNTQQWLHDCETLPLFGFLVGAYSFSTHMVGKFLCQAITLYLGEAELYIASFDVG